MDIFAKLRAAMHDYDEWPTDEKRANVIELTRQFVGAVDHRAAVIEHYRMTVTPSEQALGEVMNYLT